ncbi:hypothetical protein [Treponema sp.]|uniref:hypothetical protein n=1 Tax=Treponema sp. TaxID=166 RepID=UPI003FD7E0F6
MKACLGKFHGSVEKLIEDNEDFCPLCKARMKSEKEEKANKAKKIVLNALKVVGVTATSALFAIGLCKKKSES